MEFPGILQQRLKSLSQLGCYRALTNRVGIDFSSNDYLGFSQDEVLRRQVYTQIQELPLGSSASRLLRVNFDLFERTEEKLAQFCSRESALLYSSGYQANLGLLSALLKSEDLVYSDQLNHASIIDGIRLSGAEKRIYRHFDLVQLREMLISDRSREGLKVIVTESLYGMDGDIAPLKELSELAEEFSALFIVDEAHATGVWGDYSQNRGGGLVQFLGLSSKVFATVHTGGKAMGSAGAWICGDSSLKEYLINYSRAQIFSTALAPFVALSLQLSAEYWVKVGQERAQILLSRSQLFQEILNSQSEGRQTGSWVRGLIIPIRIGESQKAMQIANELQKEGFDVRAIRPPTVPSGTSRLRVTINWSQSLSDIERLACALRDLRNR